MGKKSRPRHKRSGVRRPRSDAPAGPRLTEDDGEIRADHGQGADILVRLEGDRRVSAFWPQAHPQRRALAAVVRRLLRLGLEQPQRGRHVPVADIRRVLQAPAGRPAPLPVVEVQVGPCSDPDACTICLHRPPLLDAWHTVARYAGELRGLTVRVCRVDGLPPGDVRQVIRNRAGARPPEVASIFLELPELDDAINTVMGRIVMRMAAQGGGAEVVEATEAASAA